MMFDNSPPPSPTTWQQVKAHIPILAAVLGALVLFVSMHTAAYAVATGAALHVAFGLAVLLIRKLRNSHGAQR